MISEFLNYRLRMFKVWLIIILLRLTSGEWFHFNHIHNSTYNVHVQNCQYSCRNSTNKNSRHKKYSKMIESTELERIFNEMDNELSKTTCEICENLRFMINETISYEDRRILQEKLDQHYEIMNGNNRRIKNPYKKCIFVLISLDSIQFPEEFRNDTKQDLDLPSLQILQITTEMQVGNRKMLSKPYYYTSTCYFGSNEIASSIKDFLSFPEMQKKINRNYEFLFLCNSDIGISSRAVMAVLLSELEGIKFRWESSLPKHCVLPNNIMFKKMTTNFIPKLQPINPFDIHKLLSGHGKLVRIVGIDFPVINYKKLDEYINSDLDFRIPQYIDKTARKDNLLYFRSFQRQCDVYEFYQRGVIDLKNNNLFTENDIAITKSNLQPNLVLLRTIIQCDCLWMDDWYKIFIPDGKIVPTTSLDKTTEILQYFRGIRNWLNEIK